jgi:hypothetical protein
LNFLRLEAGVAQSTGSLAGKLAGKTCHQLNDERFSLGQSGWAKHPENHGVMGWGDGRLQLVFAHIKFCRHEDPQKTSVCLD